LFTRLCRHRVQCLYLVDIHDKRAQKHTRLGSYSSSGMIPMLHFIFADQVNGRVAGKDRKAVRQNAMRAYRRNERLQQSRQFQEKQAQDPNKRGSPLCHSTGTSQLCRDPEKSDTASKRELSMLRHNSPLEIRSEPPINLFPSTTPYHHRDASMLLDYCTMYPHFSDPAHPIMKSIRL
jgi:hypothetical protein